MKKPDPFSPIRRLSDSRFPHEVVYIMPGEHFVTQMPKVIYTVLGSCVSACICDPLMKIGGMNHFMLPEPEAGCRFNSWKTLGRYGSHAMEILINEILKQGGVRSRLEVKVFGGANVFKGMKTIGTNNAVWVLGYIATEGLKLVRADIGDIYARRLYYFTESGRAFIKRIDHLDNPKLFDREKSDQNTLIKQQNTSRKERKKSADVTFF